MWLDMFSNEHKYNQLNLCFEKPDMSSCLSRNKNEFRKTTFVYMILKVIT